MHFWCWVPKLIFMMCDVEVTDPPWPPLIGRRLPQGLLFVDCFQLHLHACAKFYTRWPKVS